MAKSIQFITATIVLVLLRAAYVWVESSYNVALLDMMTTPLMTSRSASEVQELGHKLAALGLALLVTPFLIGFTLKRTNGRTRRFVNGFIAGATGFLALYVGGYNLQTWLMNTVVESTTAETRYEAYYSALFRQLLVDGAIEDQDFSPSRAEAAKVMWAPFGVASITNLPATMRATSADLVMERAQKQIALERFEADYAAYREYQQFVKRFLSKYRILSDEAIAKTNPEESAAVHHYGKVVESIYKIYPSYVSLNDTYREHLQFMADNDWLVADVAGIFSAPLNQRQWMHNALLKKVGLDKSFISLEDWCSNDTCPGAIEHIRDVIKAGVEGIYQSRSYGVPMGLTLREFLQAPEAFNTALSRDGRAPVFNSNVTFESFAQALGGTGTGSDVGEILTRWFPQIEGIEVPAGLTDREILESVPFKTLSAQRVGSRISSYPVTLRKEEFFERWLKTSSVVLQSRKSILLPESPEQMLTSDGEQAGLSAVRLQFIPPLAAAISATMILLNLAAIVSSAFGLVRNGWLLRLALVAALASTGYFIGGASEMPTPQMHEVWLEYSENHPIQSKSWEILFGVESIISNIADTSEFVLAPATINDILDEGLGWAL